jgi:hypothetical protein
MPTERTPSANNLAKPPPRPFDHGLRSKAMKPKIAARGREIADHLLTAGHLDPTLDEIACLEVGRLCAVIEACDASIESRGVVTGSGGARNIVSIRLSASRALESWLGQLGQTPKSRAEVIAALRDVRRPDFSESYQRRLAAIRSKNGDSDASDGHADD